MTLPRPNPLVLIAALATAIACHPAAHAAPDSTWSEHYRAARAAFAAERFEDARWHFLRADELVGGSPNALYNLAAVETRLGRPDEALRWLEEFAATGIVRGAARDTLFAPLRGDPRFAAIVARIDSSATPIMRSTPVVTLGDAGLLAEDVAYDPVDDRFFVSSIHRRKILVVDRSGRARDFVPPKANGAWGYFALRLDGTRGRLWATTCAMRVIEDYADADSGRAALECFDSRTGRRLRRIELPRDGSPHVLGDMTLGSDGTVYVTESLGGGVYALRPGEAAFDTLAPNGTFGSPQTPVLTPDGRRLLIADYPRGVASLELRTGTVDWLPKPHSLGASGIDGLYRHGTHLIAVQNGWAVKRLLLLDLDPGFRRITGWSVLERASEGLGEPSHGVLVGDTFYFLANTGWERVDESDRLVTGPDAAPPAIRSLGLR